ncbi:ferrochelatase [Longispora fulva]|uniref:Coproporphyrin III ferrochelatase n=1 Tax=Longispora fulva TaxID=619741 RepID=A0A8J7KZN4_9ACTN|nr:ferrochelatase [Longispora fulva]MBG6141377.1 ferrochelatase [Longispora fulva]GIG59473.1 ferrochelatase [Longispora fulva]
MTYDAFLLVSFGGPEGPDDVAPFLANVTRGRGVPPERLAEVAEHYRHFGGVSPINEQCRLLMAGLRDRIDLPIYWGNRNWRPYLVDALRDMRDAGIHRVLAFVTSPYGSYSSCRQYLDDIAAARAALGERAPEVDKLRHFHDHPLFIAAHVDAVKAALATLPDPANARLAFTAHSIPVSMADTAGPVRNGGRYVAQLRETARLVAAAAAPDLPYELVWQSRSGPPVIPWLEPDVNDHLAALSAEGVTGVVVSPIGFISDHIEVLWDLDHEAAETAEKLGLAYARAATPTDDPRFIDMLVELIEERRSPGGDRAALGEIPTWDRCAPGCCPAPPKRR